MVNLLPLAPVLVLLAAAAALLPSSYNARFRPWVSTAGILASLVLLWVNGRSSDPVPLVLVPFSGATDFLPTFQFGALTVFFASALLVSFLGRLLVENLRVESRLGPGALATLAGAIAFMAAENVVTVVSAWLLVDLGFLVWRLVGLREQAARASVWVAFGLSQLGALLFLLGAVLVPPDSPLRLQDIMLGGPSAALVLVAAWIRSGLYPFHYALPADREMPRGDNLRGLGITALLGLYLLARMLLRFQEDPAYLDVLQLLALVGIGATALLSLGESSPDQNLAWAARAIAAPVFFAPLVAVPAHASFVISSALAVFNLVILALGASLLRAGTRRWPLRQILWGGVVLCAAGFPLTPGFMGRIGYYAAALEARDLIVLLALVAATTLALIPLWRAFFEARPAEERLPSYIELCGVAFLVLPVLVEGVLAFQLPDLLGDSSQGTAGYAFNALFHPPTLLEPLILLGAVVLPLILSYWLTRTAETVRTRIGNPLAMVDSVLNLSLFARLVRQLFGGLGGLVHELSGLVEQYPVGWLLFAGIWVALWILAR